MGHACFYPIGTGGVASCGLIAIATTANLAIRPVVDIVMLAGWAALVGWVLLRQYVVCLLLAHALAQALELRPYMLATEFFLEPGDRLQGRIFP
jgi:hypothetical protein